MDEGGRGKGVTQDRSRQVWWWRRVVTGGYRQVDIVWTELNALFVNIEVVT